MLNLFKTFILFSLIVPVSGLLAEDKWIHITKRDGIDIYSKVTKNSPIKSLRAEGIIKSSINQIMGILRDVPGAKNWVPNLVKRDYVKNVSDTEAILYDVTNLPWPVKDRDMVIHHRLILNPEKTGLVLKFNSVEHEKEFDDKFVRAHIHDGEILFIPQKDGKTYVKVFMLVDPMGEVPKWVVNLLQVKMPYDFIMALDKYAQTTTLGPLPGIKALINKISN